VYYQLQQVVVLRHDDALGSEVVLVTMAESAGAVESDLILPYRFEPEGEWGSSEGTDEESDDSDGSQASFTERLGNTSWCSCAKCTPMPRAVECYCCREVAEVEERLEETDCACITTLESFQTVCLDKDVLYTSLVTMHTVRGDELKLPISNR